MNRRNRLVHRIIKQNRDTIGRTDRYRHAGHIGHKSIDPLKFIASGIGTKYFTYLTTMNLVRLNHVEREFLITLCAECGYIVGDIVFHAANVQKGRLMPAFPRIKL